MTGPRPFDLNLRHLRAVLAIQEERSISRAAEAVSLSQPALTQGLAKLERQLGVALFGRRSDGMAATGEGMILAERARAAMTHLAAGVGRMPRGFVHPERLVTSTQLRAFLAVADAGSYIAASATTGLSQTAVHRAVGDLERIIGGPLMERRGRTVALNAAGRRFVRGTRLAQAEIAAAIEEIGVDAGGLSILVGALPTSRPFLLPAAMGLLIADQPRARFNVLEGSWADLVEPLRDGSIDLIVGALRTVDSADLAQTSLYDEQLIVVGGSQHPLAASMQPTLDELAAFPWIVSGAESPMRSAWRQLFAGRTLPPTPIECGSVMVNGRLLTEGDFLTLLSPDQAAIQIRSGLLAQIGPPLPGTQRSVGITTRQSWRPTAIQRRFMEMLATVGSSERLLHRDDGRRMADWISPA